MSGPLVRIGRLAAAAGVTSRTVDHYTRVGVLVPAGRSDGGYRLYHSQDVERIALIRRLEDHGVSLEDIATAFNASGTDLSQALDRLDRDLAALRTVADNAAPEAQGLLAAITLRVQSLVNLAVHLPPDLFLP